MRTIAFIFARGGSKGLPQKNIKLLDGKPLIQYSIETAFATTGIEKVFVSTDDVAIASVARAAGAEIIQRPAELATDTSPEWLSWRHGIDYVRSGYGNFDIFVSLPATSPLRDQKDVSAAINKLSKTGADICISVTPANRSPYFNMVKQSEDGYVELVNRSANGVYRRQDAPEVFDITTVVYAAKPEFVLEKNALFDGKVTSVLIPKDRAVDIDDIYDFMLAEAIVKSKTNDA
ncbi:acylneuraminate cytidylyltransferase family protein [Aeromonas sp. HMWF016]|uniref:acylneuraminate cytidylyltransferase family protein n=1 Tax=Aeromonas sp. HMWF016 TaxID=2056852 RepID=UPI000D3A6DC0|nr:acylneuraminate cytidylyltransferase family protein [Aeromonas sp. HMWF016]PTT48730.1 acylneuraminate cytidylyltransferase [Aeromonas sp. HMWF016]